MKKICAIVCLLGFSLGAHATVLTFDDISTGGTAYTTLNSVTTNYGGLTWYADWYLFDTSLQSIANGGQNSNVSCDNVLFNGGGYPVMTTASSAFDFTGAYFTGIWNDGLNIEAIGYSGGTAIYDTTFSVNTSGPTWFNANFIGIDSIKFISSGGIENPAYVSNGGGTQFAMDNFTFNSHSVPEPSGLLVMSAGLFALGFAARKKA